MKNFLMIACLAVCTIFVSANTSYAIGGGGGKVSSRADVVLTNNGETPVAVWVRPATTPFPATLGELRDMLVFVGPSQSMTIRSLRNGPHEVTVTAADGLVGPDNGPIPLVNTDDNGFELNGVERTIIIDSFFFNEPFLSVIN